MSAKPNLKCLLAIIIFLILICGHISLGQKVIYVDSTAADLGDGTTWGKAFKYLQDALADANISSKPVEIWVAEGTYQPDDSEHYATTPNDINETFQLLNGVALYGGFYSGAVWENRDPNVYKSILSGDLLGNDPAYSDPCDMLNDPCRSDNSLHVVISDDTEPNAILDGFIITGGNAEGVHPDYCGGGLYNWLGSPTIKDCNFTANTAEFGGGIFSEEGDPNIINCILARNSASNRAGFCSRDGEPNLINCTISENQSNQVCGGIYVGHFAGPSLTKMTDCRIIKNKAAYGGGMYVCDNAEAIVKNCIFNGNVAEQYSGGGIVVFGKLSCYNNIFSGNSAESWGGGICCWSSDDSNLTNCTFSQNSAAEGGGIYSEDSNNFIANCIFWGNTATDGNGPQIAMVDVDAELISIAVEGGVDEIHTEGSEVTFDQIYDVDPIFPDSNGSDGIAGTADDDLRIASNSPCVDAGNDNVVDSNITADLVGNPRFVDNPVVDDPCGNIVDIGAYEVQNIYVDANATTGDMNGTSWANAFLYLQDGLYEAQDGGAIVLVAKGTYKPDINTAGTSIGDANASFELISGVGIYGGFPPGGGDWSSRDTNNNETILSGDLLLNDSCYSDPCDMLTDPCRSDNSYHVVTCNDVYNSILDGFTITGGNATGMEPDENGGGLYNNGECVVSNCVLRSNCADSGGGVYSSGSGTISLKYCTFIGNSSNASGGGMTSMFVGDSLLSCTFVGNWAKTAGGGMSSGLGNAVLTSCIFSGNATANDGGGMYNYNSSPTVTNCTFSFNTAGNLGGGIYSDPGGHNIYPSIINCILWENSDSTGYGESAQIKDASGSSEVKFSCIRGWSSGGVGNIDEPPLFIDADGNDNTAGTIDDNLHLLSYSPCINVGDPCGSYLDQADIDDEQRVLYGRVDMGADEVFPIAGDFEPDEDVDWLDLKYLAYRWLDTGCTAPDWCLGTDIDQDTEVDFVDYAYFGNHWLAGVED